MLIVTPTGIARYQWTGDELPKLVTEQEKEEAKPAAGQPPVGWPYPAANVYSGFGGYTPTYPTSTDAAASGLMVGGAPNSAAGDAGQQKAADTPKVD